MKELRFFTFLVLLFASCSKDENTIVEPLTFNEKLLLKA
jgi:hypothetical protein